MRRVSIGITLILANLISLAETEVVNARLWHFRIDSGNAVLGTNGPLVSGTNVYYEHATSWVDGLLEIPSTLGGRDVTELRYYAFEGYSGITGVVFPSRLKIINCAFANCTGLRKIEIPDGVSDACCAFAGCTSLEYASVPASLKTIASTFTGCINLREVKIAEGVQCISGAFNNCGLLPMITIPSTIVDIKQNSFFMCANLGIVKFVGDVPLHLEKSWLLSRATNVYCKAEYIEKYREFIAQNKDEIYSPYGKNYPQCQVIEWNGMEENVGRGGLGPFVPGEKVAVETGLIGYSAKGLPSGLKYDAKTGIVSGAATKPTGDAGVVVAFTKRGAETETRTFVVGPLPILTVGTVGGKNCEASGGGSYLANRKVSLKATAAKDCAFMGWFADAAGIQPIGGDYQAASLSYAMPSTNVTLYAKFISAGDSEYDNLSVSLGADRIVLTAGVSVSLPVTVVSATKYTVTAKNLPSGLKLALNKADGAYSLVGIPTAPSAGGKPLELTVKNTINKKGITEKVSIVVDQGQGVDETGTVIEGILIGAMCEADPEWNGEELKCYVGVQQKISLDVTGLAGFDTSLSVKNLPTGLRLVKTAIDPTAKVKSYVYTIEGVPTAVCSKEVILSGSNKFKWTGSKKLSITVEALPQGALNVFDGYMKIADVANGTTNALVVGTATMTVGKTGKISGKMVGNDGKSYPFSVTGYSDADEDSGLFLISAALKYGKVTIPFELLVRLEDHTSWQYGGSELARVPCSVARTTDAGDGRVVLAELRQKILGSGGKVTIDYGSLENLFPGVKLYYPLTYKEIRPLYFPAPVLTLAKAITAENDPSLSIGDYLDLKISANAKVTVSGKIGGQSVTGSSDLQTRSLTAFADDWVGQKVKDLNLLNSTSAVGTLTASYEDWIVGAYVVIPAKRGFSGYAAYVEFAYDAHLKLTTKMTVNAKVENKKLAGPGTITGELTKIEYLTPKLPVDVGTVTVNDF